MITMMAQPWRRLLGPLSALLLFFLLAASARAATVQQKSIGRTLNTGWIGVGLAVDGEGRIHMSWGGGDQADEMLHYTLIDGHRKTDAVVDAQPACGDWSALAVDSAGLPQIAYHCVRSGQDLLAYASFDGTAWHTEVLGPGNLPIAIAVDADGEPHIAHEVTSFTPLPSSYFELLHRDNTGWHAEQPGSFNVGSQALSIALDPAGHTHLGMNDSVSDGPIDATDASGDWVVTSLGDSSPLASPGATMGSLALDSQGRPHAALLGSNPTTVRYSHFDGANWVSEDLYDANAFPPGTKDQPLTASIALDAQDRPSIFFLDQFSNLQNDLLGELLVYAYRSGDHWSGVSLASNRGHGHWTRLASAPDGAGIAMEGLFAGSDTETLREIRIAVPDLTPSWTSLAVSEGKKGMVRIDGILQVTNLGAGKSGKPVVDFYLSSDDVLDSGDTLVAAKRPVGGLASGASKSAKVSLQVAPPVDGMHLIAVIDPDEQLEDRDRSNDVTAGLLSGP